MQQRRYGLRAARKRAGLTQTELAQRSGVGQGMISKLENGQIADPRFSTVMNLARALALDPSALKFPPPMPDAHL